jgi:hypothetical protein
MTTTSRLDDIAFAFDLLKGVADRQRGQPIEAAQWNTLVDVLRKILEIDRAQETGVAQALADSFARIGHEHLGRVTLSWLDPDLQERITAGGGGSISVRSALTDVTARLADLTDRLTVLSQRVETTQKRTDDTAVDQLARSAKLRAFEDRFAGLEDMRGLVTSLSATVAGLQPAVQTVLDLRAELTDANGRPIGVRALSAHVVALEAAQQDAVLGVDGTPLRLRDHQVRLQEILDIIGAGGGGGLEGRLAALAAELQGKLDTRLDERLATMSEDVDLKLAALDRSVDERIDRAIDIITEKVLDQASDHITGIVLDKVHSQLPDLVDQRIKENLVEIQKALRDLNVRVRRLEDKVFG